MRLTPFRVLLCMIVVTTPLHLGSCVRNPVTGGRQLALISESQEIAIGQESHPEVLTEFGAVEDQSLREDQGAAIPNWLSSHPAPPDRIQATAAAAENFKQQNPGRQYKVNADALLARIEGVVFGENPREGFVEKGRFHHPDLRFQLDVPQGWTVQNTKRSVVFLEPGGNAAYLGRYRMQAEADTVEVLAAFISYEKNMYQLAGMAPASAYSSFASSFDGTIRGFRELTDKRLLSVQPDHVRIYRAQKGETLRGIVKSQPQSRMTVEDLALLNRLDPDGALSAGVPVKLVRSGK